MVIEVMLLSSSFLLLAVLVALLVLESAEKQKPRPRLRVADDIKKIKEQISS